MKTKWYVTNADMQILVTADTAMDAVCEALSYMGFGSAADIAQYVVFGNDYFVVHPLGFRESAEPLDEDDLGGLEFEMDEVLDAFDEKCRKFDPFPHIHRPSVDDIDHYFRSEGEVE